MWNVDTSEELSKKGKTLAANVICYSYMYRNIDIVNAMYFEESSQKRVSKHMTYPPGHNMRKTVFLHLCYLSGSAANHSIFVLDLPKKLMLGRSIDLFCTLNWNLLYSKESETI